MTCYKSVTVPRYHARNVSFFNPFQCAKKVVSDSPGLVDVSVEIVDSVSWENV